MSMEKSNLQVSNKESLSPRVLIICALPISKSASTRAFFTYFNKIPKENIAQIYTTVSSPKDFSLCQNYYKINDSELVKRAFKKRTVVGKEIVDKTEDIPATKTLKRIITFGKKDYAFVDLMRNKLWKTKYYMNDQLKEWIEKFNPDLIFFHNSSALFMENLCLTIADFIKKPVIMEIADDYFFSKKKTISPFYFVRKKKYKKLFTKIINISKEQIYVSGKMEEKYNSFFSKTGKTIYISSMIKNQENPKGNEGIYRIGYFGNLGLGRKKSIAQIGSVLSTLSDNIILDVYSPKLGNSKSNNKDSKTIRYHGFIPYEEVEKQIHQCDLLLFVESFKKRIVEDIRYSLSTKISDYLSSGIPVFAFGPEESGSIGFLKENVCSFVCTNKKDLERVLRESIYNKDKVNLIVENAKSVCKKVFDFSSNSEKCYQLLVDVIAKNN